jgi:hypothetical protein
MAHPAVPRPVALSEANHQVIQKATASITTTGMGSSGLTARLYQLHHLGGWSPPRNRSLVRAGPNRTAHRTKSLTLYRSLGGGNPKPNTSISPSCSSKPQNTSSRSPPLLIFIRLLTHQRSRVRFSSDPSLICIKTLLYLLSLTIYT